MDEFVLVPRRLTAENGAKAALMGEFHVEQIIDCPDCDEHSGISEDEVCETCGDSGTVVQRLAVPWGTIKEIWRKAIKVVSAHRPEEQPAQIQVSIEGIGVCDLMVVDGKAIMPAVTVQDIVSKACLPAPRRLSRIQVCKLGITGRHYDAPQETRAYSYDDQPENMVASRLGRAAMVSLGGCGDAIDLGLRFLHSLQEAGFGVFELPKEQANG